MAIFTDYIAAAIMYNLQILPESLMTGILILAIVLANQALLAMAAGAAGTQLIAGAIGRIIMNMAPESATRTDAMDMCNTGFIGKAWARLLGGPDTLWHPRAPSIFMTTISFFVGYGLALQSLYKEEIDAKVVSRSSLTTTTVISFLLLAVALVFRIGSRCESVLGALGGTCLGFIFGYLGCIALGYATDRRATNVWGIPLLRDRINNGSALYICPRAEE